MMQTIILLVTTLLATTSLTCRMLILPTRHWRRAMPGRIETRLMKQSTTITMTMRSGLRAREGHISAAPSESSSIKILVCMTTVVEFQRSGNAGQLHIRASSSSIDQHQLAESTLTEYAVKFVLDAGIGTLVGVPRSLLYARRKLGSLTLVLQC